MDASQLLHTLLASFNTQLPSESYLTLGLSTVASILFGSLLVLLYRLNFNDNEPQDGSLARSLVLLVPALTVTFWMIQSSVALSLGLLGTQSFVRFRTPVKRAEDTAFVVIGLGIAVACATQFFVVATVLVTGLFLYTFARKRLGGLGSGRFAVLTVNTKKATSEEILGVLESLRLKAQFVSSRTYDGISSCVFNIARMEQAAHETVTRLLGGHDADAQINIFYPNERMGA